MDLAFGAQDLAEYSASIATVFVILLSLSIAAAALVFQLVLNQASRLRESALMLAKDAAGRYAALRAHHTEKLWDHAFQEDEFERMLSELSRMQFDPKTFDATSYEAGAGAWFPRYEEFSRRAHERFRMSFEHISRDPGREDTAAVNSNETARIIFELEFGFFLPLNTEVDRFTSAVNQYAQLLDIWRGIRRDFFLAALPVLFLAASIALSFGARVSPSFFNERPQFTSFLAVVLLLVMLALSLRPVMHLCRIARRF